MGMGNLPSPSATQSSCLPREDTPEAAAGCWEPQLAKNEYLEFAKLFGSQHEFVARRSLITRGKLPGKVRAGSHLYNCSPKMQQLQKAAVRDQNRRDSCRRGRCKSLPCITTDVTETSLLTGRVAFSSVL